MLSFLHKKTVSLWNVIKLKKKLSIFGIIILFTILVAGWFLYVNPALAAPGDPATSELPSVSSIIGNSMMDDAKSLARVLSEISLWVAGLALKLTIFVLKFVIELGGYNGYLDSQAVLVGWVMVRDVVNMGFVIILLVIAFGTILGLEQYEWKKMLVKFVLAAILVNFSRTICGLIIDAAQVVMTTFVNGVAATAGGNLIQAFSINDIMSLSNSGFKAPDPQSVFIASMVAVAFSIMMLVTMSIFLVILLFRMVSLWVAIVLSPIAFVAGIIPQTQKYASEWWKDFMNNVISGPLLIFFLWLAFVTIGSGQVHSQISSEQYNSLPASARITSDGTALQDIQGVGNYVGTAPTAEPGTATAGITSVMTWDSMANFFIALAMLLLGAKKAQELGVVGSSALGKVSDIGKKALMVASGVGAGLWLAKTAGKGIGKGAKALGKNTLMNLPMVGGRSWIRTAKRFDNFRRDNRYVKNIPIIGGAIEEKQDKLDHRLDKEIKWDKESREADFSHGSHQNFLDRWGGELSRSTGGTLGFGLQHASATKNIAEARNKEAMDQKKSKGQARSEKATSSVMDNANRMFEEFSRREAGGVDANDEGNKKAFKFWQEQQAKAGKDTTWETFENDKDGQDARFTKFTEGIQDRRGPLEYLDKDGKVQIMVGLAKTPLESDAEKATLIDAMKDVYFTQALTAAKAQAGEARSGAMATLSKTQFGEGFIAKEVAAETGKTIGDNIIKASKQTKIGVDYDKAREALSNIGKVNEKGVAYPDLEQVLATNKFAAAIYQEQQAKAAESLAKGARGLAEKEEAKVEHEEWEEAGGELGVEDRMTARMRAAKGETEAAAAESYFKTVKKNAPRYAAAAEKVKGLQARIDGGDTSAERELDKLLQENAYASAIYEEQRAKRSEAQTEEGKKRVLTGITETKVGKGILHDIETSELETGIAKSALEKIQQEIVSKIFSNSETELKNALERLKAGENYEDILGSVTDLGAKSRLAEFSASYYKDRVAGATKNRAMDAAESLFNFERNGVEVPPSAFKTGVKKAEENLTGVEREKSYGMVGGSLKKFLVTLSGGGTIERDQEEQMMAGIRHLVKNGWSDDLLAYFVDTAKRSAKGEYKAGTKEHDEGEALEKMVLKLGWADKNADGSLDVGSFENMSSEKRTNDLHRVLGFGGQTDMLLSENAVLFHSRNTKKGFSEASVDLAAQIRAKRQAGQDLGSLVTDEMASSAEEKLGWSRQRIVEQMEEFERSFMTGVDDATAGKQFVDKIKSFNSQSEILSELKDSALATTHLDDAGHTIYNVAEGFAHGQLSDTAMDSMLSDWVKLDGSSKMRKLKIHGIADMSEESDGTASNFHADRVSATFDGVDSKQKIELLDVRNRRQLIKGGSGEQLQHGKNGSYAINLKSNIAAKKPKFKNITDEEERIKAVKQNIARDWAVMLQNAPQILLPLLGNESGVAYEDAMRGTVNLEIFEEKIKDLEGLLKFVNNNINDEARPKGDVRRIREVTMNQVSSKLAKAPKVKEPKATAGAGVPKAGEPTVEVEDEEESDT